MYLSPLAMQLANQTKVGLHLNDHCFSLIMVASWKKNHKPLQAEFIELRTDLWMSLHNTQTQWHLMAEAAAKQVNTTTTT